MHVTARTYWLSKAGNRTDEYEDAFWPARTVDASGDCFRFAVADGATETSFAGLWARQLVHSFGVGQLSFEAIEEPLRKEQERWSEIVRKKPLPWYAEEKVIDGAHAALLGLVVEAKATVFGEVWTWRALAIGDCCLMHVRDDGSIGCFPTTESLFFSSRPYLLSSNPAHNGNLAEHLGRAIGECAPGDRFYLMTDALAQWFLREWEERQAPLAALAAVDGARRHRAYGSLIEGLRAQGSLRNDDVTLLSVVVT